MKYKIIILVVIALFIIGCADYEKEPLSKYPGWVVVQKYGSRSTREFDWLIYIQKNDSIKTIYTYEHYWKHYKLGDTIK